MKNAKKETNIFISSFKVDRRFWKTLLYELVFIFVIILCVTLLIKGFENIKSSATIIPSIDVEVEHPSVYQLSNLQDAIALQRMVFVYLIITIILAVSSYMFTRASIYSVITGEKLSKRFFVKLAIFSGVIGAIGFNLFMFAQALAFSMVRNNLVNSKIWLVTALIILILILVILTYLSLGMILLYSRKRNLKDMFTSTYQLLIKGVKNFLFPILFAVLTFVFVNLLMLLLSKISRSNLFLALSTTALLIYLAWLRIYFNDKISTIEADKGLGVSSRTVKTSSKRKRSAKKVKATKKKRRTR